MNIDKKIQSILKNLPKSPGVYFYYDKNGKLIYVGKASVLKHRVNSYFVGVHDNKTEELVSQISNIKYRVTNTVIEALVLESNLIKKYQPKYNIREKDDKSFVQIVQSAEDFPRFVAVRPTQRERINFKIKKYFGPYTNSGAVKEIMQVLRKLFTYRDCTQAKFARHKKSGNACLYHSIGLCPAPCTEKISKQDYAKIVSRIDDFLLGKSKRAITSLNKQMNTYAKNQNFEQAAIVRDRIEAYKHINDVAAIKEDRSFEQTKNIPERIECYDISNIGDKFVVGSMVVFTGGEIDKNEYRKFKIENVNFKYQNANICHSELSEESELNRSFAITQDDKLVGDPQRMANVIDRRFNHPEWSMPNLIILDGGKGQMSMVAKILRDRKIKIPVMAVAKGPTRKNFTLFKNAQAKNIVLDRKFIERVRDEAHRFAIAYHRKLKNKIYL